MVVAMRSAQRLWNHLIDDAQPQQILRRELQCVGGAFGKLMALPEDAGAAFGANDRVIRELEHGNSVAHADAECPAATPFADDDADDRRLETRHLVHVLGYGLRLAAFLGANARVSTGRVDETDHR